MPQGAKEALGKDKHDVHSAASGSDFSTESEGTADLRDSVTKLMVGLLLFATLIQLVLFAIASETAISNIPESDAEVLVFVRSGAHFTAVVIRAFLCYFCCIALAAVYHSLLFWETPAFPAITYPSWLEPADPRVAISSLVRNGVCLLMVLYIIRCSESLALACDGKYWDAKSASLIGWVSRSCVDSLSSHSGTVFAILVTEFVIHSGFVGLEIMLLMCLYAYSMAMASKEERELLMWKLESSSEQTSLQLPVVKHLSPPPVVKPLPLQPVVKPPPLPPVVKPPSPPPVVVPRSPPPLVVPPTPPPVVVPPSPPALPSPLTERAKRIPKRKRRPQPQPLPETQPTHELVKHDMQRMEKQGEPKRSTFARIKSSFQIIRRTPQPPWIPLPTSHVPTPPLVRTALHRAPLHRPSVLKGPLVNIKSWFGSPGKKIKRVRKVAVEQRGKGSASPALTRAQAAGPAASSEKPCFKAPLVHLNAQFRPAPAAATGSDRANMSEAAKAKPQETVARASSRLELRQGPRPTRSVERAQFFKTPGLDMNAQLEVEHFPAPVDSQEKVAVVAKERQASFHAKPPSATSQKQTGASRSTQEAVVKPFLQMRAMFEPSRGTGKPDETSAEVPPFARRPPQASASGPRAPWIRSIAAQVERQLQQQIRSQRPHFNISPGIQQVATSDVQPPGFNYVQIRGPRMEAGPPLQMPPLSDDYAGLASSQPMEAAIGAEEAVRQQPKLPPVTVETAQRPAGEEDGQQRPESRHDPRLKALQSVLIKADFIPHGAEAQLEKPKAPAKPPPETGKSQEMVGQPSTSSPPLPSIPPPPPPIPPPLSEPRKRNQSLLRIGEAAAIVRAPDMPTHTILEGITKYRTLSAQQKVQREPKPPSSERLPPAAAPVKESRRSQQPASSENAPWATVPAEAPRLPQKVGEHISQAAAPADPPQLSHKVAEDMPWAAAQEQSAHIPKMAAKDIHQAAEPAEAPRLPRLVAKDRPHVAALPSEPQEPKQLASSEDPMEAAITPKKPQQPAVPEGLLLPIVPTNEPEQQQPPVSPEDVPQDIPKPSAL